MRRLSRNWVKFFSWRRVFERIVVSISRRGFRRKFNWTRKISFEASGVWIHLQWQAWIDNFLLSRWNTFGADDSVLTNSKLNLSCLSHFMIHRFVTVGFFGLADLGVFSGLVSLGFLTSTTESSVVMALFLFGRPRGLPLGVSFAFSRRGSRILLLFENTFDFCVKSCPFHSFEKGLDFPDIADSSRVKFRLNWGWAMGKPRTR